MTATQYNPSLHRLALLTAAATFPLIFMGGLVTSHGAGMSVPDWPNSYGYNMFLFPPRLWVGGILYEHTHRLMGVVVGMLSILLAVWAWRIEIVNGAMRLASALTGGRIQPHLTASAHPRYVRWLAIGVLAAVIVQGVLGGLRVVLVELDLAIVHACFAQAFFCLAALAAVVTSRWWVEAPRTSMGVENRHAGRTLIGLAVIAVVAVYLQLIAGALMRHHGAGLAIPDVPLAYGELVPPVSEAGLKAANETRVYDLRLPGVTLTQIWLHFAHRVGAVVVTVAVVALIVVTLRRFASQRALLRPALILAALLVAQVTLGVLTVTLRKPADIASAHVAVGALLLVTAFVLAVRSMRLYSPAFRAARRAANAPAKEPEFDAATAGVAAV